MGLGMIIFGFACLHFHFLDAQVYNIEIFPLSISLMILILGFLYGFQKTRKKEYLFMIGLSCIMIGLTFMQDVRVEYLLGQTLLYTFFLLFMKKEVSDYPKSKAYCIWIILYVICGVMKTFTVPGYFYLLGKYSYHANEYFSVMLVISVIATLIHLLRIKKLVHVENHPQPIIMRKSVFLSLFTILIAVIVIAFTQYSIIEHAYDVSIQNDVYQISNDQIVIKYLFPFRVDYSNGVMTNTDVSSEIELKTEAKPKYLTIEINNQIISRGYIVYHDDQTYEYQEQESSEYMGFYPLYSNCDITLDDCTYRAKIEKIHLEKYKYEDQEIRISQCLIHDGKVMTIPRIEIFHQKRTIKYIKILDKNRKVLTYQERDPAEQQYHDGVTFYHELPFSEMLYQGEGPYTIIIAYQDQEHIIEKEYPLISDETSLP